MIVTLPLENDAHYKRAEIYLEDGCVCINLKTDVQLEPAISMRLLGLEVNRLNQAIEFLEEVDG